MEAQKSRINQFSKFFNGQKNFMTPKTIEFRQTEKYIIEISKGDGFTAGTTIYGVTVLELEPHSVKRPEGDLSACLHSMDEVEAHLKAIH